MSQDHANIRFSGPSMAIAGLLAGTAMFLGLPAIVLIWGSHLHGGIQVTIILMGILLGGLVATTAACFGTVSPSQGSGKPRKRPTEPDAQS